MGKLYTHINTWPWGRTVTFISDGGAGTVEMSFENNNPGVCYLSGLSVIPASRRKGIATHLMEKCEEYCRQNGIFRIDLSSVQEPFVLDFYHKLCFIDIEESEGFMRMYKLLLKDEVNYDRKF